MVDNCYRSKLRTPNKEHRWDDVLPATCSSGLPNYDQLLNTPGPGKRKSPCSNSPCTTMLSPHKSGYFLRTPSPQKRASGSSDFRRSRGGPTATPSPPKMGMGVDFFGNRSLLDGLAVPDWDDTFLDSLFYGVGSSMDNKTPRGHRFLHSSPSKFQSSPNISPFKSPLLTSSPKFSNSPSGLAKTPVANNSRPLTRQRKLFLASPERQTEHEPISLLPTSLPFSSLDDTASSMFSDNDLEATTSIQSISTYLRQLDDDDDDDINSEEVSPPVGWTRQGINKPRHVAKAKSSSKGKGKVSKSAKSDKSFTSSHHQQNSSSSTCFSPAAGSNSSTCGSVKKAKIEPQFTLLHPHTEILNNHISLRMAPRTPPNKVKISRDLSQIQMLPSKEQLRIVRSRFRDSLNKALEQVIEKEQGKTGPKCQQTVNDSALRSVLKRPAVATANSLTSPPMVINALEANLSYVSMVPQFKKLKG